MKDKPTFLKRAQASIERAEAAQTEVARREQAKIAHAQLQIAERYERMSVNDAIDIHRLYVRLEALGVTT